MKKTEFRVTMWIDAEYIDEASLADMRKTIAERLVPLEGACYGAVRYSYHSCKPVLIEEQKSNSEMEGAES